MVVDQNAIRGAPVRASDGAVIAFDANGRVCAANDAARALFDVTSLALGSLLGPLAGSDGADDAGGVDVESTDLQLRSLPDRWLELTRYRNVDHQSHRVAIIRDVTMARRDETLSEIIPTLISHELRTPMTSIYASAETLLGGDERLQQPDREDLVSDLSDEMRRLQLLVDDLTALYCDDVGLGVETQPELLQRILPAIVGSVQRRWRDHPIELRIEGEPPATATDRHALEHLMGDLVSNAMRWDARAPVIVVLDADPRGGAIVRVLDSGAGYRATEQHLLRPIGFAHIDASTHRTAISLHVAYRLVAAMGGRIWARTVPEGGEVGFWLRPVDRPEPMPLAHSSNRQSREGQIRVQ